MGKRKTPYTTRLDPDVATAVDRYGEDHGLTQSEAVRRLVERGLEAGDGPTTDDIDELKDMVRGLEADRDADETDRTTVEFGRDGDDGDTETETLKNASIGPAIEVIQVVLLMVIVVVVVGGV